MKIRGSNKRAAFEMSMSTVVIIVLAVVFLILGLVLLRNIFGFADESMNSITKQMETQINNIFGSENEKMFVLLGDDKVGNIRADGELFSFWVGARTINANSIESGSSIQYVMELDKTSDCYKKLGASQVAKWFVSPTMTSTSITGYTDTTELRITADDMASAKVQIKIPEGTIRCSQNVLIRFYDNTQETKKQLIAGSSFTINVLRKSIL